MAENKLTNMWGTPHAPLMCESGHFFRKHMKSPMVRTTDYRGRTYKNKKCGWKQEIQRGFGCGWDHFPDCSGRKWCEYEKRPTWTKERIKAYLDENKIKYVKAWNKARLIKQAQSF